MAGIAVDAGEALFEVTAIEVGIDDLVDDAAPMTAGALEALLPLAFHYLVSCIDEVIER